jgi:hypothetical protein
MNNNQFLVYKHVFASESTTNLLRIVRAIRFVEKGHNQIVHIIIYSWHYRWHKVYITVIMATDMLYITVIMATDMLYITVIMATDMLLAYPWP